MAIDRNTLGRIAYEEFIRQMAGATTVKGPAERLAEIQAYLLTGKTHLCHTDESRACRGGRDFQLQCWARMGLISEATDEALERAMSEIGL